MRTRFWFLLLGSLALVVAVDAVGASHWRGGTIWMQKVDHDTARIHADAYMKSNGAWTPAVGDVLGENQVVLYVRPGDGTPAGCEGPGGWLSGADWVVFVVNPSERWFGMRAHDRCDGQEGVVHHYPVENATQYTVEVGGGFCCRMSLDDGYGHRHPIHPDHETHLLAHVDFRAGAGNSVHMRLPPWIDCPSDRGCSVQVPFTHAEAQPVTMRWGTADEAVPGSAIYQNPGSCAGCGGASLLRANATDVYVDWRTPETGACSSPHDFFPVNVALLDGNQMAPLDFTVRVCDWSAAAPQWDMPPSPCFRLTTVLEGTEVGFTVQASSPDPSRRIDLFHLGLPPGASAEYHPGNPASVNVTWTPPLGMREDPLIVFDGYDDQDEQLNPCWVRFLIQPAATLDPRPTPSATRAPYQYRPTPATNAPIEPRMHILGEPACPGHFVHFEVWGDGKGWVWEFGDGTTAPGAGTFHRYDRPGIYRVAVTSDNGTVLRGSVGIRDDCEPGEDADRDGVQDMADVCPTVPDWAQVDSDGNGMGDACDPRVGEHVLAPPPGLPVRAPDRDQDGVTDGPDNCPLVANPGQEDLDRDLQGDACDVDLDGDHSPEAAADRRTLVDNCPRVSNADQADADGDGVGDACQGGEPVAVLGCEGCAEPPQARGTAALGAGALAAGGLLAARRRARGN